MRDYSIYEAKARFSEIVRRVRERGESVTITWHGEPVAEIRPFEPPAGSGWERRLQELERRGIIGAPVTPVRLSQVRRRRGALRRFLDERDG
jgi:prevent-host-death family protein